jgi:hypothetical protein
MALGDYNASPDGVKRTTITRSVKTIGKSAFSDIFTMGLRTFHPIPCHRLEYSRLPEGGCLQGGISMINRVLLTGCLLVWGLAHTQVR